MLDDRGFNLWADGYDKSVTLSDEANEYPFAGYREVLSFIYSEIREKGYQSILDIGFGTGILSKKLYDDGCTIYGIDFSEEMIKIAREKMPDAVFLRHDFSKGFPQEFSGTKFDCIVCTYAIHHLTDNEKLSFLPELTSHLNENGTVFIGDVAFQTRDELEKCKKQCAEHWDSDECYPVFGELAEVIPGASFHAMSFCAGVILFSGGSVL